MDVIPDENTKMNFFEWLLKDVKSALSAADLGLGSGMETAQFREGGMCFSEDEAPGKVAIRYGRGNAMLCSGQVMTKETVKRLRQKAVEVCNV